MPGRVEAARGPLGRWDGAARCDIRRGGSRRSAADQLDCRKHLLAALFGPRAGRTPSKLLAESSLPLSATRDQRPASAALCAVCVSILSLGWALGLAKDAAASGWKTQGLELPGVAWSCMELPWSCLELPGTALELPGAALELPGAALELPGAALELPSSLELPGAAWSYLELPGLGLECSRPGPVPQLLSWNCRVRLAISRYRLHFYRPPSSGE